MSLDNIQLSPIVVQQLFNNSLIELNKVQPKIDKQVKEEVSKPSEFQMLGKFAKRILLLVHQPNTVYVQDEGLTMLIKMISACKLSMDDVAIINQWQHPEIQYQHITQQLDAKIVLLFGIQLPSIDLPIAFPNFQIQQYNQQTWLSAPDIDTLIPNPDLRKELWNSLRQLFGV
jgi:hypothetical protein